MPATAVPAAKRNRRVYLSRKDDRDRALIEALASFQFLTTEQAANLVGRNRNSIRRRLQQFYLAAIANRVKLPSDDDLSVIDPGEFVYFLDKRGGTLAATLGCLPEPRWIESKSRMTLSHDLEITNFHLALKQALDAKQIPFEWRQWRGELRDHSEGREAIIPDAYFHFRNQSYFLEIVKAAESEYQNGESNIERKVRLYTEYPNRFRERYGRDDFRVIFVLPSRERVLNLLTKLEDKYQYKRFFITDEASYRRDVLGSVYWTPKDFRTATHPLLAA